MMAITNQEEGQFSDEVGRILLNNQNIQNKFLDNVVATAKKYGFRDIHFDFEYLRPAGPGSLQPVPPESQGPLQSGGLAPFYRTCSKTSADKKENGMKLTITKPMGRL